MKHRIYLDYAAATPVKKEVVEAMLPYLADNFYNPSANYLAGRSARQELNGWRHRAAQLLGAKPAEIIFTSGATESNNLAISGVAQAFSGSEILVSALEHSSVLSPAASAGANLIAVNKQGEIDQAALKNLINDKTVLISVMLVNNEIGTLQKLNEISTLIKTIRNQRLKAGNNLPLYLHSDAAQAPNYLDLKVSRLGVDLMSLNGGKVYGPKGSGILYVRAGVELSTQHRGGGQEFGLRSGTENLSAIAGLVTALELAQKSREDQAKQVSDLRDSFESQILNLLPQAVVNGGKRRAPHITSLSLPGIDNEVLMMQLDEQGVECATGSACSASSDEPSQTLKAIGLSDDVARSTLRFSFGAQTTAADIDKTVRLLANYAKV